MKLSKLYAIIQSKKDGDRKISYTASLFHDGKDRIIQKVGEENVEVVIAAKNENPSQLIYELADLFYHLTALMVVSGITLDDIEEELEKRHIKK